MSLVTPDKSRNIPVRAHKARTCWYRRPFRLIYREDRWISKEEGSFLLLLLSIHLLAPEEDKFCQKRSCIIVSLCFVDLVSTFP